MCKAAADCPRDGERFRFEFVIIFAGSKIFALDVAPRTGPGRGEFIKSPRRSGPSFLHSRLPTMAKHCYFLDINTARVCLKIRSDRERKEILACLLALFHNPFIC